jgi:glycosyltransferase involved in cell wall biosynthesis
MTGTPERLRIAYLFTTFPLLSETPAQREIRAMLSLPFDLEIHSLWRGGRTFAGLPVRRFGLKRLALLPFELATWLVRRPRVFKDLARGLAARRPPSALNAGETVLGLAYALCHARSLARAEVRPDLLYAAWATAPATAAQLLSGLTGIPFVLGAHAHDVFRDGGDWLLASKLRAAALVVTSSRATLAALRARGAPPDRSVLVRRGLDRLPPRRPPRVRRVPLRLLAVGRLIEKKGYPEQLSVYAALAKAGVAFEARIVGGGPLGGALARRAGELGLSGKVRFLGALPQDAVCAQYAWADVLLFSGRVARDGDRDGLPNVVPEAMAFGVAVVARAVAGVPEAVETGRSGVLITEPGTAPWVAALRRLQDDDRFYEDLCAGARAWVEAHYNARRNAAALIGHFAALVKAPVAPGTMPLGLAPAWHS